MRFPLSIILLVATLISCSKGDEDTSIFGKWKVEGFVANTTSTSQTANTDVYFTFSNNKVVDIELEINNCSGTYSLDETKLVFDEIACTEACCDSDFSTELTSLLTTIETYHFTNGDLNLAGPNDLNIRLIEVE